MVDEAGKINNGSSFHCHRVDVASAMDMAYCCTPTINQWVSNSSHVHGGSNMNTRAMKATAIADGTNFIDHGIQQAINTAALLTMCSRWHGQRSWKNRLWQQISLPSW
jgi:hypothetical protein